MMLKQKRQNEVEEAKSDKKSAMRKIRKIGRAHV